MLATGDDPATGVSPGLASCEPGSAAGFSPDCVDASSEAGSAAVAMRAGCS